MKSTLQLIKIEEVISNCEELIHLLQEAGKNTLELEVKLDNLKTLYSELTSKGNLSNTNNTKTN